jgi:DNA-directed RNA polymerase subunit RPC12/RpoP
MAGTGGFALIFRLRYLTCLPAIPYLCLACHKTFSQTLTLAEADKQKAVCPHCHSAKIEQRPSVFYAITSRKSA